MNSNSPHIVIVIPRGEVIRNFLYSDTLNLLTQKTRVTLLSVTNDSDFRREFGSHVERIEPLIDTSKTEARIVRYLRDTINMSYWRYVWSSAHSSRWAEHDYRSSKNLITRFKRGLNSSIYTVFANRLGLNILSRTERAVSYWLRPTSSYLELFEQIKPDLVFCGSHIHGETAYDPIQAANHLHIPTATFVFSWDNLTTQGRIIPYYQHFMVWNTKMREELLGYYPDITPEQVTVTGTPQFDFHFKPEFFWSKEEFCNRMGLSPERPIILYTTAFPSVFPQETGHVEAIIKILQEYPEDKRPQLLVRVYAKDTMGTFDLYRERYQGSKDVIFPPTHWKAEWFTPLYEDFYDYSNMLRYANLGINGASTVSLELCMYDKPVINLGFDPPGSNLPYVQRWRRHLEFDHYRPVAESGAVMVASSVDDVRLMIQRGLDQPGADTLARKKLIETMFEDKLDGQCGKRVADCLLELFNERASSSPKPPSDSIN